MTGDDADSHDDPLREAMRAAARMDEEACVAERLQQGALPAAARKRIQATAARLVEAVRESTFSHGGLDAFLQEYELSNREGVTLMCLAEALLRIPDADTRDLLIRDKIGDADWEEHLGHSRSFFVNASTWALMLTGRIVRLESEERDVAGFLGRLVARSGEPVIREALIRAMRILGEQFVIGRTIEEALEAAADDESRGYRHSFDMLGEAARTMADADRYVAAYEAAIRSVGADAGGRGPVEAPGISVKLSALHPRFEPAQRGRVLRELTPRLLDLARLAKSFGIGLTVDAEEADRLDLSLDVVAAVSGDASLKDWDGFGLAVQAYQKRAVPLLEWLGMLARTHRRRFMVRLVKGAYWDTEIKRSQEGGYPDYPVFTRKAATDVSYLACARAMARDETAFFPQFATHNAYSLAAVLEIMGTRRDFEFQRLFGMGEDLYDEITPADALGIPCRIYAPVGSHEDLLPYLVRRLLENGANTSFVNRIVDEKLPVADIVADPVDHMAALETRRHPQIAVPRRLFGDTRPNSCGYDLADPRVRDDLTARLAAFDDTRWHAMPRIGGTDESGGGASPMTEPADRRRTVGETAAATDTERDRAVSLAWDAREAWDLTLAEERAAMLERAADLYEENDAELMALCIREAGKTIPDAIAEVREAVDFLRYYAARGRADFAEPMTLPGPTGERDALSLRGRGVFACISPWNFPLAIFTGQVAAALMAGNPVVAKPAEQTPLIAHRAVRFLHEAGVPGEALQLLPGDGPGVGAPLVADARIAGVAFTGSVEAAHAINRSLAAKDGPIVPLIAETGGQNAMIVDSSALPEQVVKDALVSAFQSAGQRCSALRVLYLQDDIADRVLEMLAGAMDELVVGDPALLSTDVGPVIDEDALAMLRRHQALMDAEAQVVRKLPLGAETAYGTFFAPAAYEIDGILALEGEVFGPILHVVRYDDARLDAVIDDINRTGFGLTVSVHSRIDATVEHIRSRLRVGNMYVNRNQIGAVVGVQPFGGEGLSGTGPKAGGPHYLYRFAVERSLSVDTTASGGNAALLNLEE
jgi:RHH-type proline utilization regulon transcriptional repressor/proline dehydrogenase/delta 1-pyrroline-5-carboxylate dehydrogenase